MIENDKERNEIINHYILIMFNERYEAEQNNYNYWLEDVGERFWQLFELMYLEWKENVSRETTEEK